MAVYQSLSVTQVSQNQEENYSRVRILWQSTQTGGSFNDTRRTARYTISCNGQPPETYTVSYTLPAQSTTVIVDTVVTVPHNSKGEGSVAVATWMNTNISAGVVELSQKLLPDLIPQAGTLIATDGIIGGCSHVAISKKSSGHIHSLAYTFGTLSGYVDGSGQVQDQEVRFFQDSLEFSIPPAFYDQIPNAQRGLCQLTLRTYMEDMPVGQPQTASFTVTAEETACIPLLTGQIEDINEKTVALTGDAGVVVRYGSSALCKVTAEAKNGASIVRKTVGEVELTEASVLLPDIQGEKILLTAQDSRGYTAQTVLTVPVVPYRKPSVEAQAERTDMANGNASLYVSGDCFTGSFGSVDNTLSVSYSIDGVNYIPIESLSISDGRFFASADLEEMAYSQVYVITVRVQDCLFSEEKRTVLKKCLPVFDWGEQDFAFHVPVQLETPLSMESGGTGCSRWPDSGMVMKKEDEAGLSAIPTAAGALYVGSGQTLPAFGVLPVAQGGTGGDTPLQACEQLGLVLSMETGREYATYQRWMGNTVYTKLIEYGSLPNTKAKAVPHGAQARQVLGCCGTMSCGKTLPWGGIHIYRADLFCDTENIHIDTEWDYSDQTAIVQIWYIK